MVQNYYYSKHALHSGKAVGRFEAKNECVPSSSTDRRTADRINPYDDAGMGKYNPEKSEAFVNHVAQGAVRNHCLPCS